MIRREFIKSTGLVAAGIGLSGLAMPSVFANGATDSRVNVLDLFFASGQSTPEFASPGQEYQPWVYWFWSNGNITKEGIDADLEAMHRVGIGGVIMMEVGNDPTCGMRGVLRGPIDYMSDQWRELFRHTISKASSLGIKVNMSNGPSWNGSSGPWVKPENAMKVLSINAVEIPAEDRPEKIVLQRGAVTFGYYKDLCVLAFPTPKVKSGLGFLEVDNQRLKTPAHQIAADAFVPLDAVIDLSNQMNDAGEISNTAIPSGDWTLIRFGVTCKGKMGRPAPESGHGLECDKLSKRGMDNVWEGQMAKLIADNREHVGKTLVATHIDSWENGSQTWTDDMREEFLKRRRYDLWKFLPVFAGHVMENAEYTERFLYDFRRTVSDLVLENYAGRIKELAEQNGLRFTVEAINSPCDMFPFAGISDEPMGEFWMGGVFAFMSRFMASAGHVYGKRIIAAEAYTSQNVERFLAHPGNMKSLGDQAFCDGINRFVFHRYSFQPWKDVAPGGTMLGHYGIQYQRTQTWWELTPAWHEYVSRCQYMLRQGDFVADILYLVPEEAPHGFTNHTLNGYNYDHGVTDVLLNASVENGMLVLQSGMKYRVLVLPPTNRMTQGLLEKTLQLVQDGATVIGNVPATTAYGLTDYPNNERRVKELAQQLWGDLNSSDGEHFVGKGKVFRGTTPEEVLAGMNIAPDFASDIPLSWIHRRTPDAEIYFIANQRQHAVLVDVQLRESGIPEIWHPETGKIYPATAFQTESNATRLMLPLGSMESVFVVLRRQQLRANIDKPVSMSKDGKQFFDLTKPLGTVTVTDTPVKILKANYGTPGVENLNADVTEQLQSLFDSGENSFPVTKLEKIINPAPWVFKTLKFEYELNGNATTWSGQNSEMISLKDELIAAPVSDANGKSCIDFYESGKYELVLASGKKHTETVLLPQPLAIDGGWTVAFPHKTVTFDRLMSWSESTDESIRFFSGTAIYSKTFTVPKNFRKDGLRVTLDLGQTEEMAQIGLNGKNLGVFWKIKKSVDVTELLKTGENTLTISVTNGWPNRLIGDAQLPPSDERGQYGELLSLPQWLLDGKPDPQGRTTFCTWNLWKKDDEPIPSGLMGSVQLIPVKRIVVK